MVNQISLENILAISSLGFSLGALLANLISYNYISSKLNSVDSVEEVRFQEDIAENALKKIEKRSWLYQNFVMLGAKLAYENFLEQVG